MTQDIRRNDYIYVPDLGVILKVVDVLEPGRLYLAVDQADPDDPLRIEHHEISVRFREQIRLSEELTEDSRPVEIGHLMNPIRIGA